MLCPRIRPPRGLQGLPAGGSLPQVCRPSSGGLHGVHVGGGRPCGPLTYDLFRSESPQRVGIRLPFRFSETCRSSRSVVLVVLRGVKVDTPGMSRGWTSLDGLRTPLPFGPEGMLRSKVHVAGVLRMKPAAYYNIAD